MRERRYSLGLHVNQALRARRGRYPAVEYVEDQRLLPYVVPADTPTPVRLGWHPVEDGGHSFSEFEQRRWDTDAQRLRCANASDLYDLRLHYTLTAPTAPVPVGERPVVAPAPPRLPAMLVHRAEITGPEDAFLAHAQTIAALPYPVVWQFSAYTEDLFLANGCGLWLTCSTPVRVERLALFIVQRR